MNQAKVVNAKIITIIFALIIVLIIGNIIYLDVSGVHFVSQSDIDDFASKRGVVTEVQEANRGIIYSSDGEEIATNVKKYKLIAIVNKDRPGYGDTPAYVTDFEKTAETIAPIIGMDPAKMLESLQKATYQVEFGSYGSNLSSIIKKKIEATGLPGLEFSEQTSRNYPMGNFCSYIIGYAQAIENEDHTSSIVGQMGLELLYNDELAGTNGSKVYQTDASGYTLPNGILEETKPVDGNDMYLTIDSSLQRDLDLQLQEKVKELKMKKATAVIMEAKTGRILALSSYPGYDPNTRKIKDYNNFFLDTAYECGSVFKPFVYANAIEDGVYDGSAIYRSGIYNVVYGNQVVASIHDWNGGEGFGYISYDEGLYRSSNTAICSLMDNYIDRKSLIEDFKQLKLFQAGDLDGISSVSGTALYEKTDKRLEFLTTGFGQGSTVTALQLLRGYSAFANDGKMVEPYIIDRIVNPTTNEVTYKGTTNYSQQIYSPETCAQIRKLLLGVIESPVGTGSTFKLKDESIRMIGKTGTGQISAGKSGYRSDIYTKSFMGMAPYDDPQVIVYIAFQCGYSEGNKQQAEILNTLVPAALATINNYSEEEIVSEENYVIDSYMNQSSKYVSAKLKNKKIKVQLVGNGSTIIDQYPNADSAITKNDRIFLKTDSNNIKVPNMKGWSRKDVATFGSMSGIKITFKGSGSVSKQSVAAKKTLHSGDKMTVTLK